MGRRLPTASEDPRKNSWNRDDPAKALLTSDCSLMPWRTLERELRTLRKVIFLLSFSSKGSISETLSGLTKAFVTNWQAKYFTSLYELSISVQISLDMSLTTSARYSFQMILIILSRPAPPSGSPPCLLRSSKALLFSPSSMLESRISSKIELETCTSLWSCPSRLRLGVALSLCTRSSRTDLAASTFDLKQRRRKLSPIQLLSSFFSTSEGLSGASSPSPPSSTAPAVPLCSCLKSLRELFAFACCPLSFAM
mmetsp:Transcript_6792/g.19868  ORF Transcript_6792/g.19868 Transcript_6792/m.19868 type:complete len:253 (+) Transcript_6792:446-1204(+)